MIIFRISQLLLQQKIDWHVCCILVPDSRKKAVLHDKNLFSTGENDGMDLISYGGGLWRPMLC